MNCPTGQAIQTRKLDETTDLGYALFGCGQCKSSTSGQAVQLQRSTSVPVASGEHIYNRWEVHDYLKAGAISVVQTDPEMVRRCQRTGEDLQSCVGI